MKSVLITILGIIFCIGFIFPDTGSASEIVPQDYWFAPVGNHTGDYTYDDPGFQKLIDGIYGVDDWTINYGEEWVGWKGIIDNGSGGFDTQNVDLTFNFGQDVLLSSVVLGINQDAIYTWNVVFPSEIIINGGTASLYTPYDPANSGDDNGFNNGQRHRVVFNFGPIVTDTFTISLNNAANFTDALNNYSSNTDMPWYSPMNSRLWMFLDEVDFYSGTAPIPEPATLLLYGIGLAATSLQIRKKRS